MKRNGEAPIVMIGLGKMGAPMARRIAQSGRTVVGVDPDGSRRTLFAPFGMSFATIGEAMSAAGLPGERIIVTSLPDDGALETVAEGLLPLATAGDGLVDTSTVSLAASAAVSTLCTAGSVPYLRAPVSGNAVMAEAGQLTVLASGDADLFAQCDPIFACWGEKRIYLGGAEQGRVAKLALNLMIAVTSGMLAEAMALSERGGVQRDAMWELVTRSAVASPIVAAKAPALRRDDYTSTFSVRQMRKDLSLIKDAAASVGVDVPLAAQVDSALLAADQAGLGDRDYAVIIELARRTAGLERALGLDAS